MMSTHIRRNDFARRLCRAKGNPGTATCGLADADALHWASSFVPHPLKHALLHLDSTQHTGHQRCIYLNKLCSDRRRILRQFLPPYRKTESHEDSNLQFKSAPVSSMTGWTECWRNAALPTMVSRRLNLPLPSFRDRVTARWLNKPENREASQCVDRTRRTKALIMAPVLLSPCSSLCQDVLTLRLMLYV